MSLAAVSGIGLIQLLRNEHWMPPFLIRSILGAIHQDFNNYQPDVVTICLGQNDGIQTHYILQRLYQIY
jgi:hypothetical protein